MNKGVYFLVGIIILASFASAACDLSVNLLNQDPYPAIPGEHVKVVFQVNGTESTDCGQFYMNVLPSYPFSVESNDTKMVILSGNYVSGYGSYILKAYTLVVDSGAIDGDQKIKLEYGYSGATSGAYTKDFDINVKNTQTDFDVSIQSYDVAKKTITFGIVNVGKSDVESLTLDVPQQKNIDLLGASKTIIGSLSSNDDTTASIDAVAREGDITVRLSYNDEANVRRSVDKVVHFDNRYLINTNTTTARSGYFYLFWILVLILIGRYAYRYYQNRKAKANKLAILRK